MRQRPRQGDARGADDEEGPRALRAVLDGQRGRDRRLRAARPLSRAQQPYERRPVTSVGGCAVAVHGSDPNDRRMTHGGMAAAEAVRPRAPGTAKSLVLVEVEPQGRIGGIELEGRQPERGEVRRLVDLDHGSGLLVNELDREEQVLARRAQHREVALKACVDRAEGLECSAHRPDQRRISPALRHAFEPDVALLAQPIERLTPERDPVLCRDLCERLLNAAGRHPSCEPSSSSEARLWPLANTSTYGSAAAIPRASGSYSGLSCRGLSQTIRCARRERRAICARRCSGSPTSRPSEHRTTTAPRARPLWP